MAITLLPFMVFAALSAFAIVWFIEQKEKVQWICESKNIEAQEVLAKAMNELLALNSPIELAVEEKKWVKLARKMAVTPAEKAALTAQLIAIDLRLTGYSSRQKTIILSAHSESGTKLAELRSGIQHIVNETARPWRADLKLHFSTSRSHLRMRTKKVEPLATFYLEHPSLASQQEIHVRIAITGAQLFPNWIKWLSRIPIAWRESCKTQPNKENSVWIAKMHVDKF